MALPSSTTYDTLGGELSDLFVVESPATDLSAEANNETRANVAMMTRMGFRTVIRLLGVNGADPTLVGWEAVWKGADSTDPTVRRTGEGVWTITFATSVENEREQTETLNFQYALPAVEGSALAGIQCDTPSPNAITVYTFRADGTPDDLAGVRFVVWIR